VTTGSSAGTSRRHRLTLSSSATGTSRSLSLTFPTSNVLSTTSVTATAIDVTFRASSPRAFSAARRSSSSVAHRPAGTRITPTTGGVTSSSSSPTR
jgi:hypothetical protein